MGSIEPQQTVTVSVSTIKRLSKLVTIIQGYGHFFPGQDGYAALGEMKSLTDQLTGQLSPYGYCPHCGSAGKLRERRLNGNDTCENGHVYPSRAAK